MSAEQRAEDGGRAPGANRQEDVVGAAQVGTRVFDDAAERFEGLCAARSRPGARGDRQAAHRGRGTTRRACLRKSRSSGRANTDGSDWKQAGSRGSGPAMTLIRKARSETDRASGPLTLKPSPGNGSGAVGHEPDGRTQSDDVVEVGRVAKRAAQIVAVGDGQHPRRQRRGGAAARSAGALGEVVGI